MESNYPLLTKEGSPLKVENSLSLSNTFNELVELLQIKQDDLLRNLASLQAVNFGNDVHENDHRELFKFSSITETQVENIVDGLPSNKTPGADKITFRVLKDSLPAILPIITQFVNKSLATGTFARSWKMAEVIPVPKSGDSNEPANARPISLLPILSKVCERLANRQFVDFLNRSGKISVSKR